MVFVQNYLIYIVVLLGTNLVDLAESRYMIESKLNYWEYWYKNPLKSGKLEECYGIDICRNISIFIVEKV